MDMTGTGSTPAEATSGPQNGGPERDLAHFAGRVAHDFNNLLTGILGNLELLQLRAARQNMSGLEPYFDGANSAGSRAVAFAARLMLYSGFGAAPPAAVVADEVVARFSPEARCQPGAGDAKLLCDPAQLALALAELLANAKAAGGAAVLSSTATAQEVIIRVEDSGHGMSAEVLAQAHEPFFTTAGNGTGRGLGLPIVARVLRDLGGSMTIDSQAGAGCTVALRLPRVMP
jgi:signal transduction histidine kinase